MPSCEKSSSNAHAQPQTKAPEVDSWLDTPISEEENLAFKENFIEFNNLLIESYKFQLTSQKDFVSALKQFGTDEAQEQLRKAGISNQVMHVIQRSFQHMPMCRSNSSNENFILAYYSPVTDFLLLTQWSKERKITALSFQTGNSFLGIESIVPGHGIDGEIHPGIFNRSVEAYRRVARKIYKDYGFGHCKEHQKIPESIIASKLEVAIVGAFYNKTLWRDEFMTTPAGGDGIQQWLAALNSDSSNKMNELIDPRSPFTADHIFQVPKEIRNGQRVIFAHLYSGKDEIHSQVITVNPRFPHYWFGFFITSKGKIVINGSYQINNIES